MTMAKRDPEQVYRYNKGFPKGTDDAAIELYAFTHNLELGKFQHLKNFIDMFWNAQWPGSFYWDDWTERLLIAFTEHEWVTCTGPATSSKTTSAAMYCLSRFFASPHDTAVIFTSTTLDGLRRRIWREVSKFYRMRPAV